MSALRIGGTHWPNALAYPLALAGFGGYFALLPGTGIVGVWGLSRLAWQRGCAGALGRYALAVVALLLAVYLVYGFQEARFLVAPAALLALGAAAQTARLARWVTVRAAPVFAPAR